MKYILIIIFTFNLSVKTYAELNHQYLDELFNVGKMASYNNEFTLYFKPRNKPVLARGEENNYIKDYPQDLYIYHNNTKEDFPLISYDWFPKAAKKITNYYTYPVFPEDFAYYLLEDNNTLVMINTKKEFSKNFEFNIKKRELSLHQDKGKLDFIISTFVKSCGFKSMNDSYNCYFYKPLVSNYLFN